MAEKVDLSLDDIIKMNRKSNPKGGKPKSNRPATNRPSSNRPSSNRPTSNRPSSNRLTSNRLKNLGSRSGVQIRKGGPKKATRPTPTSPAKETTMLHVSNLHFNVSNADIRELFSEIGPVKKAAVHYDKSGRSLGTADVIFSTRDAAIRAIKKYSNVPLDGRPMNITLVPSQSQTPVRSPAKTRIGIRAGSGIYKKPQNKPQQRTPKGGRPQPGGKPKFQRGQRQPKKDVTAEQLDADLDNFLSAST